jgi:hypothetical protein
MRLRISWGIVLAVWSAAVVAYEEPSFRVVESLEGYEIRDYDAYMVAETVVDGDFGSSGGAAFRILAGYIFGKNSAAPTPLTATGADSGESVKMSMTVPVTSHRVAKDADSERYAYWFVMEQQYDRETLPVPDDSRVEIREVPARRVAVRRYSGRTTEANYLENLAALRSALQRDGIPVTGPPQASVYNSPFTLPWRRRNEVMLEVAGD